VAVAKKVAHIQQEVRAVLHQVHQDMLDILVVWVELLAFQTQEVVVQVLVATLQQELMAVHKIMQV
jgi:hypothetical protein